MKGKKILDEVRFLIHDPGYGRFHEINRAYRKICKLTDFNWLRESNDSLVTFQADISSYTIPMAGIRVLQDVFVKGGNDARWKQLEEMPPRLFELKVRENQDLNATNNTSKPAYYKISGGPDYNIEVTPVPDETYSVRIDYIKSTEEVTIDSNVNLPSDYFDTLAMLAAGYILERSKDEAERIEGARYIQDATSEFSNLVTDSHHNRIRSVDRTPITWMK